MLEDRRDGAPHPPKAPRAPARQRNEICWILGVGLVLSVVAVAWMLFPRESVYEGRTTSQWLATLKAGTDRDREKAVTALQRIGGEAVEGASALLAHPDAEIRLAAFDVLEGVLESCNQNFQTMNCITGYVPGRRRAARALPPIAEAVTVCRFSQDETHVTRMLVTRSLSQSEPLKTGMWSHARYGDASVRYWAASALLRYGTTDAVPALGEALKDEDANVSRTARAALQRIGGPRAMEVLEKAAESHR